MRFVAIFVVLMASLLGSGAKASLHDLSHEFADAAAMDSAHHSDLPIPEPQHHDETNCLLHAQLHSPAAAPDALVLLIALGLVFAFLTELSRAIHSLRIPARLDCRGPPVC